MLYKNNIRPLLAPSFIAVSVSACNVDFTNANQNQTSTLTPTVLSTLTATPSQVTTPTSTQVITATPSQVATPTSTQVITATPSQIAGPTSTQVITATPSQIATPTSTQVITETPSQVATPTSTQVITATPSQVATPTSTQVITATPSQVATPTSTQVITATPSQIATPTSTQVITVTPSQVATPTSTQAPTPSTMPTQPAKTAWSLSVGDNQWCSHEQLDCTELSVSEAPVTLTMGGENGYSITLNKLVMPGVISDEFTGKVLEHPNWKYGRAGAYSIQFDDWCGHSTHGIYDYGLPDFKALGIVGSIGIISSDCTDLEWEQAQEFLDAGFSIFNHSADHVYPDVPTWADPDTVITWDNKEQLSDSNDVIAEKLKGYRPEIVAVPNDIMTTDIINYIKEHPDFIGARAPNYIDRTWVPSSGLNRRQNVKPCPQGAVCSSHFEPMDTYYIKNDLYGPYSSFSGNTLVSYMNYAAQYEGWALQYAHGINDESWESITLAHWQEYIARLKVLIEEEALWIDTPENIVRYHNATLNCLTMGKQDIPYGWLYKIDDSSAMCVRNKTEVSAMLEMPEDISAVYQDGVELEFYYSKPESLGDYDIRQVYFEYMPNAGDIVILK